MRKTPEYTAWINIKGRIFNPNHPAYHNYGGRGITMCSEWQNSFSQFLSDVGPRPSVKYSIDRVDNSGNYEPGNVRWATSKEQANNRRVHIPTCHPDSPYEAKGLCHNCYSNISMKKYARNNKEKVNARDRERYRKRKEKLNG